MTKEPALDCSMLDTADLDAIARGGQQQTTPERGAVFKKDEVSRERKTTSVGK